MISLDKDFLKGSYTPIITPFKNGEVDYDAYAGLVEFQISNGGHGVLVNGTTSEPSTLTVAERNRQVDVAIEATAGRVPIVVASGSQSFAETQSLTQHAHDAGVDALLIVTPYYIKPPQRGLVAYYTALAETSDLPMMIYHIPGRTAVDVSIDTMKQISQQVPSFVGIKHAVNDLGYVTEALNTFGPDFRIFVGLEELSLPMMAVGACGMMNAVGNLAPRPVSELYERMAAGDLEGARKVHFELFELNRSVFYDTNPIPIKYMAKRMGILPENEHRLPMVPATPELEVRLDGVLQRAGLI
jgi:4-hydroxy-tetrahydrodipicolinate synthase